MVNNPPELWPATDSTDVPSETSETNELAPETPEDPTTTKASLPIESGGKISKSQRIRDYLQANPDARNRDVADDLGAFGVKTADVANVKTQLKQRSASPKAAVNVTDDAQPTVPTPVTQKTSKKTGRPKSSAAKRPTSSPTRTAAPSRVSNSGEVGLFEVEAAIHFIEQAGGIERARQIIEMVDRIRSMNLG